MHPQFINGPRNGSVRFDNSATLVFPKHNEIHPVVPSEDLYPETLSGPSDLSTTSMYFHSSLPLVQPVPATEAESDYSCFSCLVSVIPGSVYDGNKSSAETKVQESNIDVLVNESRNGDKKIEGKKKEKDPKAHMSLLSLDNIHTVSLLCWRRSRQAYFSSLPENDDIDDDGAIHLTDSVIILLYRFVGYFVLVAQFTFLWALLDLYASDFNDAQLKNKLPSVLYTAGMTSAAFGSGPLNVTISKWDAARALSNVQQCEAWILECGALWTAGQSCSYEANISYTCYPWDYERFLQGRNGSQPMCYPSDGAASLGGQPYYGSMTRGVILDWVFGLDPSNSISCVLGTAHKTLQKKIDIHSNCSFCISHCKDFLKPIVSGRYFLNPMFNRR